MEVLIIGYHKEDIWFARLCFAGVEYGLNGRFQVGLEIEGSHPFSDDKADKGGDEFHCEMVAVYSVARWEIRKLPTYNIDKVDNSNEALGKEVKCGDGDDAIDGFNGGVEITSKRRTPMLLL